MATTNLTDRVVNVTQSAFAKLGEGFGLGQGGNAMGAPMAVISGRDHRHNNEPYINQIFIGKNGGPGGPSADGWVTYVLPNAGGVTYRDSIELDELKHPLRRCHSALGLRSGRWPNNRADAENKLRRISASSLRQRTISA